MWATREALYSACSFPATLASCAGGAAWGPRFGPRLQAGGSHSHPTGSPSWGRSPSRVGHTKSVQRGGAGA
eukprot:4675072-Heterocapsa_arctica.AAC.1